MFEVSWVYGRYRCDMTTTSPRMGRARKPVLPFRLHDAAQPRDARILTNSATPTDSWVSPIATVAKTLPSCERLPDFPGRSG
jgi:hypothetical protein